MSRDYSDSDYLAIRADLVLLAKEIFPVRPSLLEAGTKRLLVTAQGIADGRHADRWGHHAKPIVQQFCAFTASEGQPPLPWQELIEDTDVYDGREGISSRTGNRPLGTTARFRVDAAAINEALAATNTTPEVLASEVAMPERFIHALCDGQWPSLSEYSYRELKSRLTTLGLMPLTAEPETPDAGADHVETRPGEPAPRLSSDSEAEDSRIDEQPISAARSKSVIPVAVSLAVAGLTAWWILNPTENVLLNDPEIVGYWDYDAVDGQHVPKGLELIEAAGGGLGAQWRFQIQLIEHEALHPRERQLWPVELHRASRKVCANYPGYPSYAGFLDLPGEDDDAVYLFGPCE